MKHTVGSEYTVQPVLILRVSDNDALASLARGSSSVSQIQIKSLLLPSPAITVVVSHREAFSAVVLEDAHTWASLLMGVPNEKILHVLCMK